MNMLIGNSGSSLKSAVDTCTFCMKMCRFACPVSEASKEEIHTPYAKMAGFFHAVGEKKGAAEIISAAGAGDTMLAYLCNNCGLCTAHCRHETGVAEVLTELRSALRDAGREPEAVKAASARVAEEIFRRQQVYDANLSRLPSRLLKPWSALVPGQTVVIPDPGSFEQQPRQIMEAVKQLDKKYPGTVILSEPLDDPFLRYICGDHVKMEAAQKEFLSRAQTGIRFLFESESMFYGYGTLAWKAGLEKKSNLHLLINEVELTLKMKQFQLVMSSVSARLDPQPFADRINFAYANHVSSIPGGRFQQPVNDSLFFEYLFPEFHRAMIANKWRELQDRPGDIICTSHYDWSQLKKSKPAGKTLHYYLNLL